MLPPEETLEIDVASAAALLSDPGFRVRLIDCREPDEHAWCRIEGAKLIPLSQFGENPDRRLYFEASPDETAEQVPVIVYCHHGMRSLNATRILRKLGFRRVWSLQGGIDAWSTEVDPSVPRY